MTKARIAMAGVLVAAWLCGCFLAHRGEVDSGGETETLRSPGGFSVPVRHTGRHGGARVLLLHGVTASKETLMFYADALAAAGYRCTLPDFPGHGTSTRRFGASTEDLVETVRAVTNDDPARFDVVVGHSMGAYAAAAAIRRGVLHPRVFVSVGAVPPTIALDRDPPILTIVMLGAWDELASPSRARGRNLFVSPWSDHPLEVFDPVLVKHMLAELEPGREIAWSAWWLRIAGVLLMGASFLAGLLLLPRGPVPDARAASLLGAAILILLCATYGFALDPWWLNMVPTPKRVLAAVVLGSVVFLASRVGTRILAAWPMAARTPSAWAHGAGVATMFVVSLLALVLGSRFAAMCAGWSAMLLASAAVVPAVVEWRARSTLAADLIFAGIVGYAWAQWIPVFY